MSNKPGHRGEREVSRKTIARGMPGETGVTVVTKLVCLFYFACEAAGASRARHSLRPLISEGATLRVNLARNARRDREAVSRDACGCLKFESVRIRGANAGLRGRSLSAVGDQAAQQVSQISAAGSRTFPSSTFSGSRAVLPKGKSATCAFVRAAASHDRESQQARTQQHEAGRYQREEPIGD